MEKKTLDFTTALDILQDEDFDDDLSYVAACLFVAKAFGMTIEHVMEMVEDH